MLGVKRFLACETGAITVDWVALTATTLLVGVGVVYSIYGNGFSDLVDGVNGTMKDIDISATAGVAPDFTGSAG